MSQQHSNPNFTGKLRTHRIFGGIKPARYKAASLRSRIMPTPIPDLLTLPLLQHQGSPAHPIVKVGDKVLKYQLLADPKEPLAIPLHAPTSGEISAIEDSAVASLTNANQLCIKLRSDGRDEAIELQAVPDYRALSHLELLSLVAAAGICGLGGAGFPTAEKLRLSIRRGVELLIIDAAECEPYISADEALLREHAAEVVVGAEILQSICLAPRCVIAIESDKNDAIAALTEALKNSSIEALILAPKYPTGGERQIIQAVTGAEVPSGKLPADIGILVQNTGTAYAVYNAIITGQPCVSRITTLTGSPLQTPKNFESLIGTPISFLFELCGLDAATHTGTIMGGSLMGFELQSTDLPVVKTTNCLIAKCSEEFPPAQPEQACIRCGYCADVCPARLLPQQLYAFSRNRDLNQLQDLGLFDCIECGACAYVCPSHIPLVQYYRTSKQSIGDRLQQQQLGEHWLDRFQFHQYRLKKEQQEAADGKTRHKSMVERKKTSQSFSREKARVEIAAAVDRVKARKANVIASSTPAEKKNN